MANEELLKRLTEAAKKAAEGSSGQKFPEAPPQEVPPTPETIDPAMEQVSAEVKKFQEEKSVPKERVALVAAKLKEAIPEAAKRIVGSEHNLPKDERVFSIVESLLSADEASLADPEYMRGIGEQLVAVAKEAGPTSPTAAEARKILRNIVTEHPGLEYLQYEAIPVIQGGVGVGEEEGEATENGADKDVARESERMYNETKDVDLKDTPFAQDLQDLQYRFRVDPDAAYDNRLIEESVKRIIAKGHESGVDEKLVQKAVERARRFQRFIELKRNQQELEMRGFRMVTWAEVMKDAPDPGIHRPNEVFADFRNMPPADVERIMQGAEGEAHWYFDFIDQIYSMGREETRPTLTQDQRYQEFKDYLMWKYGGEYHLAVQLYQKHWDSRGQYEYAVKGLMYNPGDVKDRLKAMSLLQGADLDHLYKNFDHSNEAYSLYEHVLFELMATKRSKYGEALKYMKDEVDNPLIRLRKKHYRNEKEREKDYKKIGPERLTREKLLERLKELQREEGALDEDGQRMQSRLTKEDQRLMHEIQQQNDLAAEGVMLWDDDVQSYTELHITLSKLRGAREELLKKKSQGKALTEKETDQLTEVERLYQIYSHREEMLNENFTQELIETRGLSPVDIEVRKRLIEYLRAQHPENPKYQPPEYEIRMALWAARTAMIGSGRMAMVGAMMSIPPRSGGFEAASGKDVMRAPAFEDIQRIFNPETFASRFNIGGDMGITARSIFRQNLLRTKGIDPKDPSWFKKIGGAAEKLGGKFKLTKTKEWHSDKGHAPAERKEAMEMWEFAEDATGISFTELLGPGFMASGGFYDGTAWRLEKGTADAVREKLLAMKNLPENAALLDNQALSIQLLIASNAEERKPILDRMLRRNPSKFLELLEEDTEKILTKNKITHEEWKKFKEALSLAEMRLAHEKEWQFARVDMAEENDYHKLIAPFLTQLGVDSGAHEKLRRVLVDLQGEVYRGRTVETATKKFHSKMDAIAELKLPLTMSLTDFDWKESNFYQLGTVAMHRRIRDVGSQMAARNAMLEFFHNTEMVLSPNDYTKTLQKMMEVRTAIIDYSGPEAAENTVKELMRVFLEMNRHRSLGSVGWIPGLTTLMKYAGEWDLRPLRDISLFKAIFGKDRWQNMVDQKISHWPHSVGEAISYSVRYTGSHANAWDEMKLAEVIATAQDMGLFINHPEYANDLRREFHGFAIDRIWSMPRKYWWIPLVATLAIAAAKAAEEETKRN